jgi:cytosine/adenosine deaminase-related metal-dependent hydrolase
MMFPCIHAVPEDIRVLAQSGAAAVHCIGANTKSAKGAAPVKDMLEAGVRAALGIGDRIGSIEPGKKLILSWWKPNW